MTERIRATIGFPGLPVREGFSGHVEPLGFLPTPTSVETLRHIADTISGEGAFIMQGILRKAADELETAQKDVKRYQWLRDDRAYAPEEAMVRGGAELDELCDEGIDAQHKAG